MRPEALLPLFVVLLMVAAACSADPAATTTTEPAPETTPPTVADTTLPPTTTTTPAETTTTSVELGYRWEVGDCLRFGGHADLPYEPFGSEPLATCDEAHTHQVYHTGTFPGGQEADYPGEPINTEIRQICTQAFTEYLGVLPVEVQLDILMYLPDADEWASGLRYQACLVYLPAGVETYRELTGSLAGLGGDFLLDISPGDCLAVPFVKLPPVDCGVTHLAEAIGTVTHPGEMGAPFPGEDQLEVFAITECGTLLVDYLVDPRPANPVVAFAQGFTELEWEAGWREMQCLAFAFGPGGDIAPVRGSFAEEGWTVVVGDERA